MKIKIGLCGLPNSGKSTFIKLVSQVEVLIAPYPFTTLKAQEYAVPIFSDELKLLHSITQTKEIIPPYLIFVDVPGLIRGAHKGEGLGNEFLSYLRGCDAILEIVRNFKRDDVPHSEGDINPLRDIKIIEEEIFLADKEIIERAIKKLEKEKNKDAVEKIKALKDILTQTNAELFRTDAELTEINANRIITKRFPEYNELLKEFNLLLTKEWFLLINGPQNSAELTLNLQNIFKNVYNLDLLWEIELMEYTHLPAGRQGTDAENNIRVYPWNNNPRESVDNNELKPKVFDFLNQFRKDLGLIQFFTFTQDITQGWLIKKDSSIIEAASLIHTDFGVKFKIAETISLDEFTKIKNWEEARKLGILKNKGRDAKIEENEIIFVKI